MTRAQPPRAMTAQEAAKTLSEAAVGRVSSSLRSLPNPQAAGKAFLRLLAGDHLAIADLVPLTKHPIVVLALQGVLTNPQHSPAVRGNAARVMARGLGETGMKWLLAQALAGNVPPEIAGGEVGVLWHKWTQAVFEKATQVAERFPNTSPPLEAGIRQYAQAHPVTGRLRGGC